MEAVNRPVGECAAVGRDGDHGALWAALLLAWRNDDVEA